jgi:hypothetical protein
MYTFIKNQKAIEKNKSFSSYNTEVGYCQGMSEIAALLLMYLNEEVITVKREKKTF